MTSWADERRIVVTGMGWITPLGHTVDAGWEAMMRGESGVAPLTRFDASVFPTTFASQVTNYDVTKYLKRPECHTHAGLHTRFSLGAARQAWEDAGLDGAEIDPRRIGIYLGAGEGTSDFFGFAKATLAATGADGVVDAATWGRVAHESLSTLGELEQEPNQPLHHIARELGIRGPSFNCLTACAASTQAIGEACSILHAGEADIMVSGGAHSMLHVFGVTGFNRLTALSTRNDDIKTASRPFSRTRDGFVMGEGAGVVILEGLEHALARGATPLAEVAGFGSSADAYRITDIHPEGRGPVAAMRKALDAAGIDPTYTTEAGRMPVDYISAHGTSTAENDSIETLAVKQVFADLSPSIPMSSIKSMMGHLIAAAGVVELITCIKAIEHNTLPPTMNLDDPDPALDLDYVANAPRETPVDTCLSNSFGFGGQNDALVIRRFQE
jgi:3-oxoacyl-[acyl-carrier-protein] synthase II